MPNPRATPTQSSLTQLGPQDSTMHSMDHYRQQVCRYFAWEYSDFSFQEVIDQIQISKNMPLSKEVEFTTVGALEDTDARRKHHLRWENKITQIISTYHHAGKPASHAAGKLAKILKAYTRSTLLNA